MSRPNPLPNALDLAYGAGLTLASPVLAYNLVRTGKWRSDWRGRLGHGAPLPVDARPTVLLHGVSVGEVVAARPLVEALGGPSGAGPTRVVVSATTNTGFARASELYADHYRVVRFPLDFSRSVHRFLDRIRPHVVGLMELEVWPNFTRACQDRGIATVVLNGRLSASSFKGYRRARAVLAPSFRRLAGVAAQTRAYAERFRAMGVPGERIVVSGSLKWDVPLDRELDAAAATLASELGIDRERPVVVAVSTGPGEEARLVRGRPDGVQLVVVPRKPERFEEVARLGPFVRRSEVGAPQDGAGSDLFLVDTMGEAEAATALADVVVVGRSFNGMGGSNPIPAAQLGRPAVVGPDHHNFQDVVEALTAAGACRVADEPWAAAEAILADGGTFRRMAEAGPRAAAENAGATGRNVELIRAQLRDFRAPVPRGSVVP